jgi:hypothetical protein
VTSREPLARAMHGFNPCMRFACGGYPQAGPFQGIRRPLLQVHATLTREALADVSNSDVESVDSSQAGCDVTTGLWSSVISSGKGNAHELRLAQGRTTDEGTTIEAQARFTFSSFMALGYPFIRGCAVYSPQ